MIEKRSSSLRVLLLRLTLLLFLMSCSRLIFYLFNQASFPSVSLLDIFVGVYFDIVSISLYALPFIFLSLLPFPFRLKRNYQLFLKIFFLILVLFMLILNLIDVVYYSYTSKRSTIDLFTILGAGEDFGQQIGSFLRDFWFLILALVVFIALILWLLKKIGNPTVKIESRKKWILSQTTVLIFSIGLAVILGRGGLSLKPISPIDASQYTRVENAAFVLNTPFTMLKSFNKPTIEEKHYFSLKEEQKRFNPIRKTKPQHLLSPKTNVVIILLESFGNEWVGAAGAKESFTPFLDSLCGESLYFQNGISNGKKSIEAIPAVLASIPSWMDNPYISSPYGDNKIVSLADILNAQGYETSFFHGATNGSMKFDGFAAQAGFDHYFGRKEYGNDADFDGTWGILDEKFAPWMARKLSEQKAPFFASLFTLSSHHPYYIPPHMRGKLKKGPQQICESIAYGDYSLRQFFEEAKKQAWFKNTLFVLCADHTSATSSQIYNQRTEMYKIPILFFDPQGRLKPQKITGFFQQIDIMPTILDLLNLNLPYYSFGQSYFQQKEPEALTYIEGTYNYFFKQHMLTFTNDQARNLYSVSVRMKDTPDSLSYYKEESKALEMRLKAIIQRYNRDLISNQTRLE